MEPTSPVDEAAETPLPPVVEPAETPDADPPNPTPVVELAETPPPVVELAETPDADETPESSWSWGPEEPSTSIPVAVLSSAESIWAWKPDEPVDLPVVEPVETPPVPAAKKSRKQGKTQRGKGQRRKVSAPKWETLETVTEPEVKSQTKLQTKPTAKPVPEVVHVPVLGPGKRRRPRKVPPPTFTPHPQVEPEPAPTKTRKRSLKVVLVAAVFALCAALPWLAPQLPDLVAKAIPGGSSEAPVVRTADPTPDPVTPSAQVTTTPGPALLGTQLAAGGKPLEVSVPRLHVRSQVVPISGQSGELLPPNDPQVLGWWQEGREAGTPEGSMVVTGHTVSTGGGAFDHLGELVPGDRIRVRTAAGSIEYVVQESRDVPVAKLAETADEIFSQHGDGRLVLITCSDFNGEVYLSNSVVYATPVADEPKVDATSDPTP